MAGLTVQGTDANGVSREVLVDSSGRPLTSMTVGGVAPQLDDTDKIAVSLYAGNSAAGDTKLEAFANGADSQITSNNQLITASVGYVFNGSQYDLLRGNVEGTALASAARTAQADSSVIVNYNGRYLVLHVNITADPGTASITPNLLAVDPIDGSTTHTIWTAAAALTGTGQTAYQFGPGLVAATGGGYTDTEAIVIPRSFIFRMTVADAESMTYSVTYCLVN